MSAYLKVLDVILNRKPSDHAVKNMQNIRSLSQSKKELEKILKKKKNNEH